jgi:hypothetical protein
MTVCDVAREMSKHCFLVLIKDTEERCENKQIYQLPTKPSTTSKCTHAGKCVHVVLQVLALRPAGRAQPERRGLNFPQPMPASILLCMSFPERHSILDTSTFKTYPEAMPLSLSRWCRLQLPHEGLKLAMTGASQARQRPCEQYN